MGLFDKIVKTVSIWLDEEEEEFYEKEESDYERGLAFEQYVVRLFKPEYYAIEEWTRDNSDKRQGIKVESDMNPDFIVRLKKTGERFAVECKYRSNYYHAKNVHGGIISWSKPSQIQRYQRFSEERNIPVFVVIGVMGEPSDPKYMYCLPLDEAKYPQIYSGVYGKYRREPGKPFFFNRGALK